jgi:hypothetical protein
MKLLNQIKTLRRSDPIRSAPLALSPNLAVRARAALSPMASHCNPQPATRFKSRTRHPTCQPPTQQLFSVFIDNNCGAV